MREAGFCFALVTSVPLCILVLKVQEANTKTLRVLLPLVLALVFVASVPAAGLEALPSVLRIGVYNNPPKIGISDSGRPYGFHIELIEELLKETGIRPEYVPGTWEECLARLQRGEIDVLPDVAYSAERAESFDFNRESVLTNWAVVYAAKSASLGSIADLDRKRVAVMKDSIHTIGENGILKLAESYGISCDFLYFDSYEETFRAVEKGEADAAIVNRLFGLMNEGTYDVRRTSITFNPSQIRYAFSKSAPGGTALIELFDARLAALKQKSDSVYHRAFSKYLLPQIAKERTVPQWIGNTILLAIAITLVLALFLISSRSGKKEHGQLQRFFREYKSMGDIRVSIADHTLSSYAIFSFPLLLSVLYHLLTVEWSDLIWVYVPVLLTPAIAALFRRRLSINLKTGIVIVSMFATGILTLVFWGNVGTGFMYFLTAGLVVGIVYGKRSGLAVLTLGLVITVILEIIAQNAMIGIREDMISSFLSPSSWLFAIMSFFMMFFTITNGIEEFYTHLIDAVENLEQRIAERTEYIDSINKNLQVEIVEHNKTEEKLEAARLEAEQANKAKSVFLAGMSHEIRTPLNAILGYSQLLMRDKDLSAEARREIETIGTSGEHLLGLINEILEMSKIEAGRVEIHEGICFIPGILKQVRDMFEGTAAGRGIDFSLAVAGNVPGCIVTDESKLKQILINLVGNAFKFTDSGFITIDVSASAEDSGMISFTVSDSGKGIEPENIERIFQPFEQTREGRLKGGTGLGLSISRQYCSLLGGELVAESEIGQGSRFTFTIRAKVCMESEVETKGSDTATIGIKSGSVPRILVVDDKEANRDILVRMLQPLGFPATAASSGQEALDMVDSWAPDLILLDLIMPDLSGKDVLRILRTDPDKGNIRIIVLTASAQENDKDEVLSLGANAFIRKPFRQNDILDEIGSLFGLEYFHEARKSDDAQAVALTAQGLAERMAALPEDLIRRLSEGLNMGDLEEVKNLTAEMDSIDPVLAEAIRKMADDFSVGPLLDILQAKG